MLVLYITTSLPGIRWKSFFIAPKFSNKVIKLFGNSWVNQVFLILNWVIEQMLWDVYSLEINENLFVDQCQNKQKNLGP